MVPRGSPPAAFEARAKEAEALRARFQGCEEGIALARGMRYVAVRTQVVKGSAELPAQLRDVLAKTEIGRLTAPETTPQGVEVYALCGKRQSESAPAKKEVRDEMFNEAFEIALQEIPQGTARSSHDRIPVGLRPCRDRWR